MTSPQERADALADELRATTTGAAEQATSDLQRDIRLLLAALAARWVLEHGSLDVTELDTAAVANFVDYARRLVARLTLDPGAQVAFESAVDDAYQRGLDHARQAAPDSGLIQPLRADRRLPDLSDVLATQRAQALSGLEERTVADRGFPAVVQSVAKAARTTSRIEAFVAYEVTRSANQAVRDVTPPGWQVIWVPERDACLHCLAYAGETAIPGGAFSEALTFADRPLHQRSPLLGPPAHPHCRCCLQPLHPSDTAVVTALKREARRSVLRGWADDESEAARLRAADRLLNLGAGLPPTVEARARRAVRDGRFN